MYFREEYMEPGIGVHGKITTKPVECSGDVCEHELQNKRITLTLGSCWNSLNDFFS